MIAMVGKIGNPTVPFDLAGHISPFFGRAFLSRPTDVLGNPAT
jgi:hypothetical protein